MGGGVVTERGEGPYQRRERSSATERGRVLQRREGAYPCRYANMYAYTHACMCISPPVQAQKRIPAAGIVWAVELHALVGTDGAGQPHPGEILALRTGGLSVG